MGERTIATFISKGHLGMWKKAIAGSDWPYLLRTKAAVFCSH